MGCTVAELGARMSGRELNDWIAYAAIEPFGEEQADRRTALLANTIAAGLVGKKAPSPEAFLKQLRPEAGDAPRPIQSPAELKATLSAMAARSRRAAPPEPEPANGKGR